MTQETHPSYEELLKQEAEVWGASARQIANDYPPDWRYQRNTRDSAIVDADLIDAFLDHVQPGMNVLEIGCHVGWLTLAMAQRGAHVTGIDLSSEAIAIAENYYKSVKDSVMGTAEYLVKDINTVDLPANTYDIIVAKAVLHHLIELEHVVDQIHKSLKPGGLFWVIDTHGSESLPAVLAAGAFSFLLPTQTSYREKFSHLLRYGTDTPSRVKASIEAEGLSPFEGVGRATDWLDLLETFFVIEQRTNLPSFTGYVTAQLRMSDRFAMPLLRAIRWLDLSLVRLGVLQSTGINVHARKAP